ncbi:MAG: AAA family ATPase [Ruminococcus sp.]|nr:AAA family ATPase [Ruminococcus sp.]
MVALLYCRSGGGKTVNSTLVKGEKNLLLCSDNSEIVLRNFPRDNLTIKKITHCVKKDRDDRSAFYETALDEAEQGYTNIIIDNLSDLFDMWLLELEEKNAGSKDRRQDYQYVYNMLKRIVRKATLFKCNVIFTAWTETRNLVTPDGKPYINTMPKLPAKIIDNICGLCNCVGYITHGTGADGKEVWWYVLKPTKEFYAKDQLYDRDSCYPENIFEGKE